MKDICFRLFFRIVLFSGLALYLSCDSTTGNETDRLAQRVVYRYYALNGDFDEPGEVWGNYTLDLTFEAMLAYDKASGHSIYIDSVMRIIQLRNLTPSSVVSYKSQPFGCLTFALYEATGDSSYLEPFLAETEKMKLEGDYSAEGGVLHGYRGKQGLLIDYVQNFATRLAMAGAVSGHSIYFEEAVRQYEIFDSVVRRPADGLYSQGRGFLDDPSALSPGAWSRGQGWILRGLVSTMRYLPDQTDYMDRMQHLLEDYADSLISHQSSTGMWHQLVHLPFDKSAPETSGTGFIAYYLAVAINQGYLPEEPYTSVVKSAVDAVKLQITRDGSILNGCRGPGPIVSTDNYFRSSGVTNEPHAFATTIYALAADRLMN